MREVATNAHTAVLVAVAAAVTLTSAAPKSYAGQATTPGALEASTTSTGARLGVQSVQAGSSTDLGEPFSVGCGFSHRLQDDPIVSPGQPGGSHDHTFFGNNSTNAFSTGDSLREHGQTSCANRADASAYWAPTLFVAGRAVEPLGLVATYSRRTSGPVDPFPPGLKVIAGNANARRAQSMRVTYWSCAVSDTMRSSTIPRCPGTLRGGLRLHVSFPNCWDGRQLDSADHKRHMAYSARTTCPLSHPVAVPALSLVIYYPVRGSRSAELASCGQFSAHADFVNAWKQATLARLVSQYLNGA